MKMQRHMELKSASSHYQKPIKCSVKDADIPGKAVKPLSFVASSGDSQ